MPKAPVCDFCSSKDIQWTHYARPFTIRLDGLKLDINMSDDWAACDECHQDILDKNWAALLERSHARVGIPSLGEPYKAFIEKVHAKFRENRTGDFVKEPS